MSTAEPSLWGHQRIVERLASAARELAEGKTHSLAHALIFAGPEGVGKFRVACWWAARLKCSDPACSATGACRDCKQIAVRSHPDVTFLEPDEAGSIKIERVRDLIASMALRPLRVGPRIALVRDAEQLTPHAQSAMLKLLEEPPGFAVLVLITRNPSALLATLRSRCLMIRYGQLDDADVQAMLQAAGRERGVAETAASLAGGSPGRALALSAERLADREELIAAYEELRAGDSADIESLAVDLVERGKADRPALHELLEWQMRKVEAALGHGGSEASRRLAPLLDGATSENSAALLEEAARTLWAIQSLARNGNAKLVLRELLLDVRPA